MLQAGREADLLRAVRSRLRCRCAVRRESSGAARRAPGADRDLTFPARERPCPPRLPRRLRRDRPARLRPAQQGLRQDRGRRPGAGQGAAGARRRRRGRTIADYRGDWVLVNLWASWCLPCRDEAPVLEQLVPRAPRRGRHRAGDQRPGQQRGRARLRRRVRHHLPAAALGRRRAQRSLRLDRGARELPRRPARQAGADLARPGRRAASSTRSVDPIIEGAAEARGSGAGPACVAALAGVRGPRRGRRSTSPTSKTK